MVDWTSIFQLAKTAIEAYQQVAKGRDEITVFLSIQKFKDNYSVIASRFRRGKPILPAFPADMMFVDEENVKKRIIDEFNVLSNTEPDFIDLGNIMYNYFIPYSIRDYIDNLDASDLIITTTTEHDIPWEFIHNGKEFWCMKYNMGRVLYGKEPSKQEESTPVEKDIKIAVIASDRQKSTQCKERSKRD
jgi:hypothetical protein